MIKSLRYGVYSIFLKQFSIFLHCLSYDNLIKQVRLNRQKTCKFILTNKQNLNLYYYGTVKNVPVKN